jgi:hypothetical protein
MMLLSDSFGILPVLVVGLFQTSTALVSSAPGTVVVGLLLFIHAIACLNLLQLPGRPSTAAGSVVAVVVGCVSLLILSPASFVLLLLLPLSVVILLVSFVSLLSRRSAHRVEVPCPTFGDSNRQILAGVTHGGGVMASWYSFCCGSSTRRGNGCSTNGEVKTKRSSVVDATTIITTLDAFVEEDGDERPSHSTGVMILAVVTGGVPLLIVSPRTFVLLLLLLWSFLVCQFVVFGLLLSCGQYDQVEDQSTAPCRVFGENPKRVGGTKKTRRFFVGPQHGDVFWYSFFGSSRVTRRVAGCAIGDVEKKRPASVFKATMVALDTIVEEDDDEPINNDLLTVITQFDDDGDAIMTDAWDEGMILANDVEAVLPSLRRATTIAPATTGCPLPAPPAAVMAVLPPSPTALRAVSTGIPLAMVVPDSVHSVAGVVAAGGTKTRRFFVGPQHGDVFWYSFFGSSRVTRQAAGCASGDVEKKRPASVYKATMVALDSIVEEDDDEQTNKDLLTIITQFDDDGDAIMTDAWESDEIISAIPAGAEEELNDSFDFSFHSEDDAMAIPDSIQSVAAHVPPPGLPESDATHVTSVTIGPIPTSPAGVAAVPLSVPSSVPSAAVPSAVAVPASAVSPWIRPSDPDFVIPEASPTISTHPSEPIRWPRHDARSTTGPVSAPVVLRRSARLAAKNGWRNSMGTLFIDGRRCSARLASRAI